MNLHEFSIRNPVSICMILLCFLVLGGISIFKIPLILLPEVDFPGVEVYVPYPNATPDQVERTITKPLEEALATVSHLKHINSTSEASGGSVNLEFDWGMDMDVIRAEVREKVEQARLELPDDVDRIFVRNFSSGDIPIIEGRISSGRDLRGSYDFLEHKIKKPLERVRGVAEVEIDGVSRREITIRLRLDDLKKYRVDVGRLFRRLDSANLNLSMGRVRDGDNRFNILARNLLADLEAIRDFPVDQRDLRLQDIADVSFSEPPLDYGRHLNGGYAIAVTVRKASDANVVQTVRAVREKIDEINRDPSLQGIQLLIWHDSGEEITKALSGLLESGLYGSILAVLILFIFLRRIGATLAVAFAIPFSIVAAVGFIYLFGRSLNVLSMMGLMLSAGMLVDNAVVVLESIFRHMEKRNKRLEAAREGTQEVVLAVVASTLTSIIIFVPLIFGRRSEMTTWLSEVGISIIIALCCSLFVSLALIPMTMARFIHMRPPRVESIRTAPARLYERALGWTMRHRAIMVTGILLVVGLSVIPFQNLPDNTPQAQEMRDLRIQYEFTENYHYAVIEQDFVNPVERILSEHKGEWKIKDVYSFYRNGSANTLVYFDLKRLAPGEITRIRDEIGGKLPVIPGARISLGRLRGVDTANWIGVNLYGDDTATLDQLVMEAKRKLRADPAVREIHTAEEGGTEEVQIRLNRDVGSKYGVSAQSVGEVLAIVLRGRQVRSFHSPEGEVEIWVKLREEDRENIDDLRNIVVSGGTGGGDVLLSHVADLKIVRAAKSIEREDRRTRAYLGVICAKENRDDSKRLVQQVMDGMTLPLGYTWSFDRWVAERDDSDQEFLFNMLLALFMVYFVMASLFESLAHPFAIMFSLPFAFVGVAWFLFLTHTPFNIMAQIGLLVLIGVVVNNGIVLIAHVNDFRRQGRSRAEAIREGCLERLRPILMTAGTTIVGLIPLALGTSSLFEMRYFPMARTVLGGLFASTFLTLLVLPTVYCLIDDLALWSRRLWLGTRPGPVQAPRWTRLLPSRVKGSP